MASKCKICGDEKNYNFAINNGLCNSCIYEKLDRLEEALEELKNEFIAYGEIWDEPEVKTLKEWFKIVEQVLKE